MKPAPTRSAAAISIARSARAAALSWRGSGSLTARPVSPWRYEEGAAPLVATFVRAGQPAWVGNVKIRIKASPFSDVKAGELAEVVEPLIIFDTDLVIGDGSPAPRCAHPRGLTVLISVLVALGYELRAWSAGGAEHARAVVAHAGLVDAFAAYHTKPDYPMTERACLAILGRRPALQVDDDPSERVADWPFLQADNWFEVPIL
jgi:hypothetical protein